jgi:hypothetical protein
MIVALLPAVLSRVVIKSRKVALDETTLIYNLPATLHFAAQTLTSYPLECDTLKAIEDGNFRCRHHHCLGDVHLLSSSSCCCCRFFLALVVHIYNRILIHLIPPTIASSPLQHT